MGSGNISTVIALAIMLGTFYLVGKIIYNLVTGHKGKSKYCMTCGHEGRTKIHTRGNLLIEIILWLCLLIPGLIYSIWRVSTRHEVCSNCGAGNVVPPQSPAVRAARARMDAA